MIDTARPWLGQDEIDAVSAVLKSGILSSGPNTDRFESAFADYLGVSDAIAVNSGTSALVVALMAADLSAGAEVIVPSFTFAATANAVRLSGAVPVFADIEADTFCLSPESAAAVVTPRTEAIMPVHLYGHPADMGAMESLASRNGLALFEDAAQAHGAAIAGRPVGGIGLAGAFSFYPTKNMTTGEGGMVTTDDPDLARRARLLRNQGMAERYVHEIVGMNVRISEVAAAIGIVQLEKLPGWNQARIDVAARYTEGLGGVVTATKRDGFDHVFNQYTILSEERDRLKQQLFEAGVGSSIYYPIPTHRQAPFRGEVGALPVTDFSAERVLSLPMRPDLTGEEVKTVIDAVNAVTGQGVAS